MKLTVHCQLGVPFWLPRFLHESGARWVKLMDPGAAFPLPECPDVNIIVRFWRDAGWERDLVWQGTEGADRWVAAHRDYIRQRPWLSQPNVYLEVLNEPHPMSNRQFRLNLDLFTARVVRRLWEEFGIRTCGHNWSVGWPDVGQAREFVLSLSWIVECNGLLGLHEYGWPGMNTGNGYWTLRYRRTVQELTNAGIVPPRIAITECGLDSGLVENRHRGWKSVNSDPKWYAGELAWYNGELERDDYVVCATVFTATPAPDWLDFEVTEALSQEMARLGHPVSGGNEPPVSGGSMKIYDLNGIERDDAWLRATYGNVTITTTENDADEVIELREAEGPAVLRVTLLDVAVRPISFWPVAFSWPDAPVDGSAGGLGRAVRGITNEYGEVEFALGRGAYYDPAHETGPHAVWPWGQPGPIVSGLGMLMNTEHRHLDVVFREKPEHPPPPEPPPPPDPPTEPLPVTWPLHDLRDSLDWNPNGERWEQRNTGSITQIVVHHTGNEPGQGQLMIEYIRSINRYHIEHNGWPRIGYHYVIGLKGVIWHCNPLTDITYHAGNANVNLSSVGIALVGDLTKRDPTPQQLNALKWLCQQIGKYAIGHKEVVQTACPGNWWPFWKPWLNDWMNQPTCECDRLREILEEIRRLAEEGLRLVDSGR